MKVKRQIDDIDDIELELIRDGKLRETGDSSGYVNNKELYEEYQRYFAKKNKALEEGKEIPPLSEKIGAAIIQIATRRCNSRQFVGYSNNWKEELISHAIMTATIRGHNFNPEKSNNPFAYLTQICNNAILEQLKKEKRQLYIKYKGIEEANGFNGEVDENNVNEADLHNHIEGNAAAVQRRQYISDFEEKNFTKQPKDDIVDPGLMNFIDEE